MGQIWLTVNIFNWLENKNPKKITLLDIWKLYKIQILVFITKVFFFTTLDLHCCAKTFSSFGERGLLSSCSARPSHQGVCGAHALGKWAQSPHIMGKSSWTRDWTGVLCFARQILNHWTTREAQLSFVGTQPYHLFMLQWQSWMVVTETSWPAKPKILAFLFFLENVFWPLK